jgi:hypothetical protein
MARKSVGRVSCPNDTCALHDRRGRSNVVLHGYSKTRWGRRRTGDQPARMVALWAVSWTAFYTFYFSYFGW